jgi:hypothetical protein
VSTRSPGRSTIFSLLALDYRVGPLALDDEAQGVGGVAMGAGLLARQHLLHAADERVGGAVAAAETGVEEAEGAALGLAIRRVDDGAGLVQQLPQERPAPDVGHQPGDRLRGMGLVHE